MVAFGATAPVGSLTVPVIVPEEPTPCPRAIELAGNKQIADTKTLASKVDFITPPGSTKTSRISFRIGPSSLCPQMQESRYDCYWLGLPFIAGLPCGTSGISVNSGSLFGCLPLDASIKNYDSLYHVLSTNVKTERTAALICTTRSSISCFRINGS
jgi:hypothetical protein